jgi:hypothetical protein
MLHEPSDSRPSVQQTAGQRCPSCRVVRSLDDFSAGTRGGCCGSCRRRRAAVTRRCRRRTLQQVARRAEASYRALLTRHWGGDGDAS